MHKHGDAGRERGEAFARNADRKLDKLDKLDQIEDMLGAVARAVLAIVEALTQEKNPMATKDEFMTKLRGAKTVMDGLIAVRTELRGKLEEARAATSMGETNALIDEAMAVVDTMVDPEAGTSPIVEGTAAEDEAPPPGTTAEE